MQRSTHVRCALISTLHLVKLHWRSLVTLHYLMGTNKHKGEQHSTWSGHLRFITGIIHPSHYTQAFVQLVFDNSSVCNNGIG